MNKEEAIKILEKQISLMDELPNRNREDQTFQKWRRDTKVALENIYSSTDNHVYEFTSISFSLPHSRLEQTSSAKQVAFLKGLNRARTTLLSMLDEIRDFGLGGKEDKPTSHSDTIINLFKRFHLVVKQLKNRHENRETLNVDDEYDVQDLLHALLRLSFDDVRREEYTPSYAGGNSRIDFLLKKEKTAIESKKTRKGLDSKKIGEELIVDTRRYQEHQDVSNLYCFVYDPEGRIKNPRGLETDLSGKQDRLNVIVIVAP
jgi:hypothetical protein